MDKTRKLYIGVLVFSVVFLVLQALLLLVYPDEKSATIINLTFAITLSLVSVCVLFYVSFQTRKIQPSLFPSWLMLSLAMACNPIAGIVAGVVSWINPSVDIIEFTNLSILIVYPFYLLMVALFPARSSKRMELMQWTHDSLILITSLTLFFWFNLIQPNLSQINQSNLHLIYSVASQIGDVMIIWAMVMLLFRPLKNQPSGPLLWLFFGFLLLLIYDLSAANTNNSFSISNYTSLREVIISASIMALTIAGANQLYVVSNNVQKGQRYQVGHLWDMFRAVTPYLGLSLSFGILLHAIINKQPEALFVAITVAFILVLVVGRQLIMIYENQRLNLQLLEFNSELELRVSKRTEELSQANLELRKHESLLEHNALHDSLTDLPNRALLIDRIHQSILRMKRDPRSTFGILFMDLDGFKVINDTLGHLQGDQLLVQFAQELKSSMREVDTVARLGGDEFVILLENCSSDAELLQAADRVLNIFNSPIMLEDQTTYLNASIGIVPGSAEYENPSDLLRDADLAMYEAKTRGKAQAVLFSEELRSAALDRMLLERGLRDALSNQEMYLVYQPIINLLDQKLTGFEALLRWKHPIQGLVPPSNFIPIAEANGMIVPITIWVMDNACAQLAEWKQNYPDRTLKMNVNLSVRLFNQSDLIDLIQDTLKRHALNPEDIILEITESAIIQNTKQAQSTTQALHQSGIQVQLDDFGTGYSSLSYLHQFALGGLKIAQDFVLQLQPDSKNREIIQSIVNLAKDLNLDVIAEGIETAEQLTYLTQIGCRAGQGYYLSYPLEARAAGEFIQRHLSS